MPAGEIHVGDTGLVFQLTVFNQDSTIVPLGAATIKQIIFQKSDGSTLTQNLSFYTDGSDGIVTYTTGATDLNIPGIWSFQIYIQFNATSYFESDITKFTVFENILM